ncbi:inositol 5-phosphatase 4 [Pseudomonas chlororaphis subsp. aurantiaca]|nr:inositol 5-phosphatase 4 [Pseudomonas chlororaphis subsp. aurantiaca]
MTDRPLAGPQGVAGQGGNQGQGEGEVKKFAHGKTVGSRVRDSLTRVGPMSAIAKGGLRIWINKLSVTVIERLGGCS